MAPDVERQPIAGSAQGCRLRRGTQLPLMAGTRW